MAAYMHRPTTEEARMTAETAVQPQGRGRRRGRQQSGVFEAWVERSAHYVPSKNGSKQVGVEGGGGPGVVRMKSIARWRREIRSDICAVRRRVG